MADIEGTNPPSRSDGGKGLKHEAPVSQVPMRNCQPARAKTAAAPQDDIEIEDSRTPPFPAAPSEFAFEALQLLKHPGRLEIALDDRDGICKITAGSAMRGVEHDGRGIEEAELLVEAGDRGLDDGLRTAMTPVGAIRADRDRVEVRCVRHGCSPRSAR